MGNRNKLDNKLKHAVYVAAVLAMNERFQLDLTKIQCKSWEVELVPKLENPIQNNEDHAFKFLG